MYFYPYSKAQLKPWAENLLAQISAIAARINEPAADVAKLQENLQQLITALNDWETAHQALQRLTAVANDIMKQAGPAIRDYIKRLRTNPLLTEADAHLLQIISTTAIADLTNYQPKLTGKQTGGTIHLSFQKHGAEAMNVYTRLHGETNWVLLGIATQSPYIDTRPLANPTVPEIREYYVMPILANKEVGQRSEVLTIKYTG
ncbi:MAG: hypothetical protein QM726_12395 [Chitinophagaceae bacterium]